MQSCSERAAAPPPACSPSAGWGWMRWWSLPGVSNRRRSSACASHPTTPEPSTGRTRRRSRPPPVRPASWSTPRRPGSPASPCRSSCCRPAASSPTSATDPARSTWWPPLRRAASGPPTARRCSSSRECSASSVGPVSILRGTPPAPRWRRRSPDDQAVHVPRRQQPSMNLAFTLAAGAAGAAVGLGIGWLNVFLERLERLRPEEDEERAEYEAEVAKAADAAWERGEEPEAAAPWLPEQYGWTWLEWGLALVLGAFAFRLFAGHQPLTWGAAESFLWIAVFVQIVLFDLKHRLILDKITYPAIVVAVGLSAVTPGLSFTRSLTGALVVGGFFVLFHLISRRGIGLGDAKLGALIGAVTGLGLDSPNHLQAIYAVTGGIFLGGAVALLLLLTRVRSLKDPIPYGPFLCAGAVLVLFQSLPLT